VNDVEDCWNEESFSVVQVRARRVIEMAEAVMRKQYLEHSKTSECAYLQIYRVLLRDGGITELMELVGRNVSMKHHHQAKGKINRNNDTLLTRKVPS
jgi:hypothetical protein